MKKTISAFLSMIMLLSTLSIVCFAYPITTPDNIYIPTVNTVNTYTLGDVDGNGEINALDSYVVKHSIVFGDTIEKVDSADFNLDGIVSASDVLCMKACIVGVKNYSDYATENNIGRFSIGGIDITQFEAVVPVDMTYDDNKYLGYEYLSKYLKVATGVELPLRYGESSNTGHGIYFNTIDYYSDEGQALGIDGYTYKVENGNLYIYGTLRGNGYAVFDILENWLGFKYCASDRVYSFTKRTTDIPENYEKTYIPSFAIRSCGGIENNTFYARIRGMNSMVNESSWYNNAYIGYVSGDAIGTVHSFDEFRAIVRGTLPSDEDTTTNYYYKAHDGLQYVDTSKQVCATNDEVYEEIFEGMLMWIQHISAAPGKYFETEYGVTYAAFGISDNQNFCTCALCRNITNGTTYSRVSPTMAKWLEENYTGEYTLEKNGSAYKATFKKENTTGLYLNMINRAARDIQEYYPGLKIVTYFYPNIVPETIRPESNMYIWYCGACNPACEKHSINEECNCDPSAGNLLTTAEMLEGINAWREVCDETGAELGYWCYFTNYGSQMFAVPNYDAIWGTIHKLGEIGLDGVYYECGSIHSNPLEAKLKSYLAQKMIWNSEITYEEYRSLIKEYLFAIYGDASEDIYNYILMSEECMNSYELCFAFWYKAFDIYSESYLNKNYENMRSLLVSAREKVNPQKINDVDYMLASLDLIGLTAVYDDWYVNGTTETRDKYCSMYDNFYNTVVNNGISVGDEASYSFPTTINYDSSPVKQIYKTTHQFAQK